MKYFISGTLLGEPSDETKITKRIKLYDKIVNKVNTFFIAKYFLLTVIFFKFLSK